MRSTSCSTGRRGRSSVFPLGSRCSGGWGSCSFGALATRSSIAEPAAPLIYRQESALARCDLHLHSSASTNQEAWIARHFGCPESYAEPVRQYELCKARGMSFVTLTDHDTIAGGLTL